MHISNGTLFLAIVIVSFIFFATQWGSRRGPGSFKFDFVLLFIFIGIGVGLMFIWGSHGMVIK
jgi:hypothetical protein